MNLLVTRAAGELVVVVFPLISATRFCDSEVSEFNGVAAVK